jgi:hypothetical protein
MRRPAIVFAATLVAVLAVSAPVTLARFRSSDASAGTLRTGSILPPTGVGASVSGTVVTLTWTPTSSTAVTGYDVLRSATSGSGYGVVSSVTPWTATTTTNSPGTGTWYYVLRSSLQSWRSVSSGEASATIGTTPVGTGFKACSTNAADTGGDGNGYETNPGNACAPDGSVATDASSGTTASTSCADAGKDRHRFAGYGFGLPGSVTSINGITVQLRVDLNNNGGTTVMCVQLSWDGGTTWTATKSVSPTNSMTTFTLGGATDTWGHTPWTLAELDATQFRVRVIDASSMSNKTFSLDWLGVQVTYTP